MLPAIPISTLDSPAVTPFAGVSPSQPPSLIYNSEEEHQAQLDSVFWFYDQRSAGAFQDDEGKFIAVSGNAIVDKDFDIDALAQRVESSHPPSFIRRTVIQYVPCLEEWAIR